MSNDNPVMMKCGHAANATWHSKEGDKPSCAICAGLTPDALIVAEVQPDLTGRRARCHFYGHRNNPGKNEGKCQETCDCEQPSSYNLAFFEYRGPGCSQAEEMCTCHYSRSAHPSQGGTGCYAKSTRPMEHLCENNGGHFTPVGPQEFDEFYCGCIGWD